MSKTVGLILSLSDKCSPQLQKIQEKMGLSEKQAKNLNNRVQKLSKSLKEDFKKATVACVAGISAINAVASVMVMRSIDAGDRIDKMSQKMQMSRQTFQELEYVFSQNGASIEVMQTGMSKLSKIMESARGGNKASIQTFRQLGISLKDNNDKLKTTEKVMFEAFSRLQKMPEGATKSALALELFGKSATELAPLLNGNAKGVDELRKKFNDSGMGLSDKQIDSAVKFKDTMDTIQRTFEGLGNQIGADLLPQLQTVADTIIKNMPQIKATVVPVISAIGGVLKFTVEHFRALSVAVGVLTGAFVAFKAVQAYNTITLMLSSASKLIPVLQALAIQTNVVAVATKAGAVAQGIFNAVMNANPIVLACTAIAGLITLLVALELKFHVVTNAVQKFKDAINKIKNNSVKADVEIQNKPAKVNGKYAGGTDFAHGGLSLVGERGPELVNLPRGSQVLNNSDTQKALNKNITINLNVSGSVISEGELINKISNVLGRQLQTALQC